MKITRRAALAGAGAAACVAGAGPLRAMSSPDRAGPAPAGAGPVLRITQAAAGAAPSVSTAPLHWQLAAGAMLDAREFAARVAGRGRVRIQAELDGANHLLLVDALRAHGGAVLRQRWSQGTQRWTLVARVQA